MATLEGTKITIQNNSQEEHDVDRLHTDIENLNREIHRLITLRDQKKAIFDTAVAQGYLTPAQRQQKEEEFYRAEREKREKDQAAAFAKERDRIQKEKEAERARIAEQKEKEHQALRDKAKK